MLKKSLSKTGKFCRVTFDFLPPDGAITVALCGEFNDWNPEANQMAQRKDGRFSATVSLETGKSYRFKFLIDGKIWESDPAADGFRLNEFGTEDSIVSV
jgi:1,4-alpha-glucan branching enzyme